MILYLVVFVIIIIALYIYILLMVSIWQRIRNIVDFIASHPTGKHYIKSNDSHKIYLGFL